MFKLPQKIKNDISNYQNNLNKYLSAELRDSFFRGIRVPWGNYSQRGGKLLMSRLRIPAGILIPRQLNAIGNAAKNYADGKLHITTRQDIQIHNVPYENSIKIIEYLKDFDISPRGGGGNTVRNITCCYLSGICSYEKIEVYRLVWGLSEYLLSLDEAYNLPRKFKCAFSGCSTDCSSSGVNDIGFIATDNGFKVIVGGGMGAKSAVGKVIHENLTQEEVGYVVKAVMSVFNKYGDRKNKHHNRLRFLIQDIGWEKFSSLYCHELDKVKNSEYIVLRTDNGLIELPKYELSSQGQDTEVFDDEYKLFIRYNLAKQKQEGYYYVSLCIPFGEIDSDTLIQLAGLGDNFPGINFRTTQRQNLIISNVPHEKVFTLYKKIREILKDYLYPDTILDITCCKAATTCNLGICNAMGLAPEIVKELKKLNLDIDKLKEIRININGCPNACAQHPIGTLSFSGLARKVYKRTVPFYRVYFGGIIDAENTKLAQEIGIIPARTIPRFVAEFVSILQNNIAADINQYVSKEGAEILKNLITKYSFVPSYEEDRSYYVDFAKEEDFSLDGLSQGECGAGVIDMIESDLATAEQFLAKAKELNFSLDEINQALIHSARALLVVKGIDPKDEKQTISTFINKFIDTGICDPEFREIYRVYTEVDKCSREEMWKYVQRFYDEIKNIYSLMDSSFNFPIRFEIGNISGKDVTVMDNIGVYDLRGTPCPLNYVKAKLKLEELKIDDILQIYLDDGEPIQNVPKSLKEDGQEIIRIEQVNDYYNVIIRKKI